MFIADKPPEVAPDVAVHDGHFAVLSWAAR
jgi:hypothetical protein